MVGLMCCVTASLSTCRVLHFLKFHLLKTIYTDLVTPPPQNYPTPIQFKTHSQTRNQTNEAVNFAFCGVCNCCGGARPAGASGGGRRGGPDAGGGRGAQKSQRRAYVVPQRVEDLMKCYWPGSADKPSWKDLGVAVSHVGVLCASFVLVETDKDEGFCENIET